MINPGKNFSMMYDFDRVVIKYSNITVKPALVLKQLEGMKQITK